MEQIHVTGADLNTLTAELENAIANFNKSYKALEERLVGLTSRGFTGDAATALMDKFNSNVKPNSEAMIKVVNGVLDTMKEKTAEFKKLNSDLTDRMLS